MPAGTRAGEIQTAIVDDCACRPRGDHENTRGRNAGSGSARSDSLGVVAGEESRPFTAGNARLAVLPVSFQFTSAAAGAGAAYHESVRRDGQHDGVREGVCAEVLPALVLGQLHGAEGIWICVSDVVICCADLHVSRLRYLWMPQG